MTFRNALPGPFSAADQAAIAAIVAANMATNQALAELARAMAGRTSGGLDKPRKPRLARMTHGENGELIGDVEYSDGRVRRFHASRDDNGDLVAHIEDLDPVAPAPTVEAEPTRPEPQSSFADVFGSIEF